MFGFDWVAIVAAAIAGGVGGAIGGLLGGLTKNSTLRGILIIVPTILGARLATPFIQPEVEKVIGPSMRGPQFDAVYETDIRPGLMKMPAYVRVFKDHREVEVAFKEELRKAFLAGGAKGMNEAAVAIGTRVLGDVMIRYVPFARDEDLIEFAKTFTDALKTLQARDPEVCVLFLHGPAHGKPLTTSQLTQYFGEERFNKLSQVSLALIANASQTVVPFDRVRGQQLMEKIGEQRGPLMTEKSSEVVTGARLSQSAEESRAACAFFVAIYEDIAALPSNDSATVLRYIFTSA